MYGIQHQRTTDIKWVQRCNEATAWKTESCSPRPVVTGICDDKMYRRAHGYIIINENKAWMELFLLFYWNIKNTLSKSRLLSHWMTGSIVNVLAGSHRDLTICTSRSVHGFKVIAFLAASYSSKIWQNGGGCTCGNNRWRVFLREQGEQELTLSVPACTIQLPGLILGGALLPWTWCASLGSANRMVVIFYHPGCIRENIQ